MGGARGWLGAGALLEGPSGPTLEGWWPSAGSPPGWARVTDRQLEGRLRPAAPPTPPKSTEPLTFAPPSFSLVPAPPRCRKEVEESNAVEKKGHMGDFYRNLLRNNVAFGT